VENAGERETTIVVVFGKVRSGRRVQGEKYLGGKKEKGCGPEDEAAARG